MRWPEPSLVMRWSAPVPAGLVARAAVSARVPGVTLWSALVRAGLVARVSVSDHMPAAELWSAPARAGVVARVTVSGHLPAAELVQGHAGGSFAIEVALRWRHRELVEMAVPALIPMRSEGLAQAVGRFRTMLIGWSACAGRLAARWRGSVGLAASPGVRRPAGRGGLRWRASAGGGGGWGCRGCCASGCRSEPEVEGGGCFVFAWVVLVGQVGQGPGDADSPVETTGGQGA